jgi:predicted amino acid racemase
MFLDVTRRRNPALIDAAVRLHQAGAIPSNCYVIDIDTVAANAGRVAQAGADHGLALFQMTKQFGRNPLVAWAVADAGIERAVAVDFEEARVLHAAGIQIGHLGHLVQVPAREVARSVSMRPDYMTVFGLPQAERISAAASAAGRVQRLLIRVIRDGDTYYPAQRGGVPIEQLANTAKAIDSLPNVEVAGATSFPCVLWDEPSGKLRPTPNLSTARAATELMRASGLDAPEVNAPSASCLATFGMLAENGATQAEPGSCLTGQTPLHAVTDQPERPAMIYVTEVTHTTREACYTLGGGFYPRSRARRALVYSDSDREPVLADVELDPADAIDYYGTLHPAASRAVDVGNTVVYAFRAQVFVSRCFVAVIRDVATSPEVLGLFDRNGFPLDAEILPVGAGPSRHGAGRGK